MAITFGESDKGSDVKMYKCGERLKESKPRVKGEGGGGRENNWATD